MIYQIEEKDNLIYEVTSPDKCISKIPVCKGESIVLTNGPSKVEILVSPKSSPGPRGRSMVWDDLTPLQKEEITPTISVGQTTTLPSGSEASVTDVGSDKNHILDFAIPQGIQGQAATIQVAGTVTVNPDTPASVINEGSETDARFRFHIPQGQTGEKGDDGVSPTIRVGSTTTGQPGTNASVTNSGTAQNMVLNFTIPQGQRGNPGPAGQVQDVQVSYDAGQTWESAMTGNVAEIIMSGGGGGGGGGEINRINKIQKNGVDLPIVNKVVDIPVPTNVSQLTQDVDYALISSLSNVALSGSYNDLTDKPTIPEAPIASISINGVTQPITNKNVDLPAIPTASTRQGYQGFAENAYYAQTAADADEAQVANTARSALSVPLDGVSQADDLKAIEALSGTTGLLKKTAANTWTLDTTSYITSNDVPIQTISNNGTQLTITNHNVDLMIPDAHYDPYNNEIVANSADWANTANSATNATYASYMEYTGLIRGDDLKQIQSISGTSSTSPAPKGLLKRTGRYIPYPIGGGEYPEWVFDDTAYITLNDVPVQSISVNGTTQTITNKNVDITIPTALSGFTDDLGTHPVHTHDQYTVDSTLASVAKSGSYSDLSGVPTALSDFTDDLGSSPVHTHSQYAESANLASVATSGDYGDLINTPSLASVAISGDYDDLSNVPTKLSDFTDDLGSSPVHTHSQYAESANLATVATSGSYTDLSNTPTIPQPAQSIASGETGYATGDQVYNWSPIHCYDYNDLTGSSSTNKNLPTGISVGHMVVVRFKESTATALNYTLNISEGTWWELVISGTGALILSGNQTSPIVYTKSLPVGSGYLGSIFFRIS